MSNHKTSNKPEAEKKTEILVAVCTDSQKELIETYALKCGLSVSSLLLNSVLSRINK